LYDYDESIEFVYFICSSVLQRIIDVTDLGGGSEQAGLTKEPEKHLRA